MTLHGFPAVLGVVKFAGVARRHCSGRSTARMRTTVRGN